MMRVLHALEWEVSIRVVMQAARLHRFRSANAVQASRLHYDLQLS